MRDFENSFICDVFHNSHSAEGNGHRILFYKKIIVSVSFKHTLQICSCKRRYK